MKHFLFATILGLFWAPSFAFAFIDVSSSNEHYASISSLVEQGTLEGYEDDTFRPDQEVNRAEALKMFLLGMGVGVNENSSAGLLFSDVNTEAWYAPYVGTAVTEGVVQGYADNTFRPEQTVNRAEAMKMLALAGGIDISKPSISPFMDIGIDAWYSGYAEFAKNQNIVPPQTDGLWHGEDAMTRGEIAEMVYRLQLVLSSEMPFEESTNWLRLDFPTVDITMKVPFNWGIKQEGVGAVFLLDSVNGQLSLLSPYENGGTLLMTRYSNPDGTDTEALFDALALRADGQVKEVTLGDYEALQIDYDEGSYVREWYLALPNQALVNLVVLRGDGYYASTLDAFILAMVESIEYSNGSGTEFTLDEIVEQLREMLQVDGVGAEIMGLLSDWELYETDTIGVGTGPVDYYYSPSVNITVKYERSYDVLLDLREGETSAF